MKLNIRYLTDTGTGKDQSYFNQYGIDCLPLQISDDSNNYLDMEEYSHDMLIHDLRQAKVLKTSMCVYGAIDEYFKKAKEDGVDIVFASPICQGLSGNRNAIESCANEYGVKCYCFEHYVTAVVQEYLIITAKHMLEQGHDIDDVFNMVDSVVETCNTLILANDLQHLKRGGRLTPTAATLATLLKIKPIMHINKSTNGKVDVLAKIRTLKKAIDYLCHLITDNCNQDYQIYIAHVDCIDLATSIKEQLLALNPSLNIDIIPLCNSVSVHIGIDGIAIQYFKPQQNIPLKRG